MLMRIAIIDAGLGGLSIHGLIDKALRSGSKNNHYELLFFNIMPASGQLYLYMSETERILLFQKMLHRVIHFDPDLILVACNSLSVLLHHFSESFLEENKISGIIEAGVKSILDYHQLNRQVKY